MAENNKEKDIIENEKANNTNNEELKEIKNKEKTENKEAEVEKAQTESKEEFKSDKREELKKDSETEANKEKASKKVDNNTEKQEKKEEKTENKEAEKEKKEDTKKFEPVKKETSTSSNEKSKVKNSKKDKKIKEKKTGKGTFTRIIAIIIILLAIIGLIYLAIPTPEKTLNNFFNSLKNGNIEKINQYLNYDEISLEKVLNEGTETNEVQKALFESLEWNIKSVTEEQDIATIEVEVTNKDYEKAFKSYIQEMFQKFLNNEDVSDEEQFDLLINEISKEETGTKTTTQTITLSKENGQWKVNSDDSLIEALYPGLVEGIDSISNITLN